MTKYNRDKRSNRRDLWLDSEKVIDGINYGYNKLKYCRKIYEICFAEQKHTFRNKINNHSSTFNTA